MGGLVKRLVLASTLFLLVAAGPAWAGIAAPGVPRPHFVVGVTSGDPVVVKVRWAPSSTSGACYRFDRNDYGELTPLNLATRRSTSVVLRENTDDWDIFGFQVQAYACTHPADKSAWVSSPLYGSWDGPATDVTMTGAWRQGVNGNWYTSQRASMTVSGSYANVGFTAIRGPKQGKARVYVDGSYQTTVNLHSTTLKDSQMIWTKAWPSFAPHTITIVNLATTGHPRLNWEWMPSFLPCGC